MLSSSSSSSSNELQLAIQEANKVTTTTDMLETSVKLRVLKKIVDLSQKMNDRVVVVSGWTSTLDIIEKALSSTSPGLRFTRLDGTTPSHKRTQLVTTFNNGHGGSVFLLSRKAGGVGLNLIGANRLVLFDCDWNPANDLQATARIHRDGQMKNTFIYRLLTAFTLEEKIFQRQCQKGALARSMGFACVENATNNKDDDDEDNDPRTFSSDELRKLFKFEYARKTAMKEPCEMAKVESCQSWMNDCRFSGTLNDDVLKQMDEEASGNEDVRFYAKLS
jgi:DNA repair and recombination protein RAD54B